jgi:ParB family transcriptional regulator, chromosome partitioning protein
MAQSKKTAVLEHVPTRSVQRNEHNPRLIFRGEELEELADSIQDIDVQVPISVFRDGSKYVLIDGERRWRACQMINRQTIPAIIYPKPGPVQNIVFMFNIHRFRKDWDPLPTAMKLEELKELIEKEEGVPPSEAQLAALTGMTRGAIRRCKLIMEIPASSRRDILAELEKPEHARRITTDLFVECQRSVRTIRNYLPHLASLEVPLRDALIRKYKTGTVVNVVHMRMVAKIARAATKGVSPKVVESALKNLIEKPALTIEEAYSRVAWVYDLRSLTLQARALASSIEELPAKALADDAEVRELLRKLAAKISELLG